MTARRELVKRSEQWLLDHRVADEGGWGEQPGRSASALNTAEVLLGLLEFEHEADLRRAQAVKAGASFLTRAQVTEGENAGAWARHVPTPSGVISFPDVIRTALALQAVVRAAPGENADCVAAAVRWILGARNQDGLWAYGGGPTQQTSLVATCCAAEALIDACRGADAKCEAEAVAAITRLTQSPLRRPDRSFGTPGPLQAAHTMHVILLLQKARECNVAIPAGAEESAVAWLLGRPPDDVVKMVEEQIELDPARPVANYGFLYVTDTLAVRVLAEAEVPDSLRPARERLYADAVASITARSSDEGGFYGQRVLSWSTARAMAALWVAKDFEPAKSDEGPQGRDTTQAWAVLTALVIVLAGGLAGVALDMAAVPVVGMVILLFALTLMGFGFFSEKGLVEFVKSIPKGLISR